MTYTVVKPAASNPTAIALPADIMTPTGKVTLGGAQTGNFTVAGPKKNDPVPGNGAFPSFSMTGTFTVTAPGRDHPLARRLQHPHQLHPGAGHPLHGHQPARPGLRDRHRDRHATPVNTRAISLGSASGNAR